jgi:hypothetical protein
MITIKVFTKLGCSDCNIMLPKVREYISKLSIKSEEYDIEDEIGMSEAAFYDIMSVPAVVIKVDGEKSFVYVGKNEINKLIEV